MKKNQSQDECPLHQTVAEEFEFECGGKSIAVGFTEQKLSAHAGSATFWAWLHGTRWSETLARVLPHRPPTSNNHLTVLFQRHLGWQTKVTIHSLRFWLFITPGLITHPAGKTTIKLAVPPRERDWWARLWEKILSPFPNCNAVENRPVFAH